MQVSYFKTYSSKKIKKAIEKVQLDTLGPLALLNLRDKTKDQEKAVEFELTPELKKRLLQNKKKLTRKSSAKKVQLKSEWVRALFETKQSNPGSTVQANQVQRLPLKQKPNYNLQRDRELLVLKYQGNFKDPYYQLRNVSHISLIQ